MLKIVPDPPLTSPHFEDLLAEASEHSTCARAVVHQALLMQPHSPAAPLILATLHELDSVRRLLDGALAQLQLGYLAQRSTH